MRFDPETIAEDFREAAKVCRRRGRQENDLNQKLSQYMTALELLDYAKRYLKETKNPASIYHSWQMGLDFKVYTKRFPKTEEALEDGNR